MFEDRPIWLRTRIIRTLDDELEIESNYILKKMLAGIAYNYKDGPWKNAYVRIGYDPRQDVFSMKY